MPFWLFRPAAPNGGAVIVPHGHGGGKEGYKRMTADGAPYVAQLVAKGYFVACPDARGAGDRREYPQQTEGEGVRNNSHRELMNIAIGFGQSVVGMMVWDLMRLIDFLQTQPEIKRIAATGMSGGGQQTLWLTALDDRVSAAMTSGYFYGVKEALLKQPSNCACNFVPHFYTTMDMGDLGAMIAPRPFMVESGENDHLNGKTGIDNVYPQVEITRRAYQLLGAEDKLTHNVHEGKHEWRAIGLLEFLDREFH
jgi:dienelactone hydrolase